MRPASVAAAAAVLGGLLGCAGSFDQWLPTRQRAACQAWVEHVNGLEGCLHVTYDPDNLCRGVEEQPEAIVGWFECLSEHSTCDGAEPRFEPDLCQPPVRPEEVHG